MKKNQEMKATINTYWHKGGYGEYQVARFEWAGMAMEYKMGYIPAYCGGMFIYDFYPNWEVEKLYRTYRRSKQGADANKMREWYKRFRYFLGVQHLRQRASHEKLAMDVCFWEVTQNVMHGFGLNQRMSRIGERLNPNSGNTAQFFATPFDGGDWHNMHDKHGDGWIATINTDSLSIPFETGDDSDSTDLDW